MNNHEYGNLINQSENNNIIPINKVQPWIHHLEETHTESGEEAQLAQRKGGEKYTD